MANIARLGVVLGLNTAEFQSGLAGAMKGLDKLKTGVMAAGAAAVAAGVGLAVLTKSALNNMDALAKQSQMAGVTVESLSALSYAAELAGVNQDDLTKSMVKLTKGMSDAQQGTGEALKGFQALGLDVNELGGADGAMAAIAEQFAGMEDGAGKTALALAIFGRAGAAMIPLLNGGADGLLKMKEEARILGLVISTDTAKAAEVFNDSLTTLSKITQGLINRFAEGMLPALNNLSQGFFNAYLQSDGMREEINKLVSVEMVRWAENIVIGLAHIVDVGVMVARVMVAIGSSIKVVASDVEVLFNAVSLVNPANALNIKQNYESLQESLKSRQQTLEIATGAYKKVFESNGSYFADLTKEAVEQARLLKSLPKDDGDLSPTGLKRTAPQMITIDKAAVAELKKMSLMLAEAQKLSGEYSREREHSLGMLRIKDQLVGLTANERRVQEAVNEVLNATSKKLEEIASKREAAAGRGANEEVLAEYDAQAKAVQDLSDKYAELARVQETSSIQAQQTFSFGWNTAFRQFAEDSENYATLGKDMFSSITGAMSSAIDQFVEHGKFAFGDFATSVIKDLIKIELKMQASQLLRQGIGMITSAIGMYSGGGFGTGNSFGNMDIGGFLAEGGTANAGTAYVVGERGPEIFVPNRTGTVIPNNMIGSSGSTTNITNNYIDAIDTKSFEDRIYGSSRAVWSANQFAGKSISNNRSRT